MLAGRTHTYYYFKQLANLDPVVSAETKDMLTKGMKAVQDSTKEQAQTKPNKNTGTVGGEGGNSSNSVQHTQRPAFLREVAAETTPRTRIEHENTDVKACDRWMRMADFTKTWQAWGELGDSQREESLG
eukprot:1190804-Amphidinium_carterae.1